MLLSKSEVKELTGKVHYSAQVKALRTMGIECVVRPDGTPAVSKEHVDDILTGGNPGSRLDKSNEPDWSMV